MKPKNLKQAFENGFVVGSIYNKFSKKIRVDLKRRFYEADEINFVSFWVDREYFKRKYPSLYERS
jgi:hypothetical protein